MRKMSAKEKVVRYMAATRPIGSWFYSYELAGKMINGENTGTDADTRLYQIINDDNGIFRSPNYNYYIEKLPKRTGENQTRYTWFRISRKEPKTHVPIKGFGYLRDYTFAHI